MLSTKHQVERPDADNNQLYQLCRIWTIPEMNMRINSIDRWRPGSHGKRI